MSEDKIVEEVVETASNTDHVVDTPREEVIKRAIAFGIDVLIFSILIWAFGGGLIAMIVSSAFMVLRDVIFEGQSPGKKVMGLKVVDRSGLGIGRDYMASIKRNILFLLPYSGFYVGLVEGAFLLIGDKIPIIGEKIRFGDKFANTDVVDA